MMHQSNTTVQQTSPDHWDMPSGRHQLITS